MLKIKVLPTIGSPLFGCAGQYMIITKALGMELGIFHSVKHFTKFFISTFT